MRKFDVQVALEGLREAREKWHEARTEFLSGYETVLTLLLHEAAVNYMSQQDVAKSLGVPVGTVRSAMRQRGLDPRHGSRLLSKHASEALSENAALLGIQPHEMDLMSPLAYLPMGEKLKRGLQDQRTSQVDPDEFLETEEDRLRRMLLTLGFCPTDGESMPCGTCGAGL